MYSSDNQNSINDNLTETIRANFPAELQAARQWLVWKYEANGDGRPTKVPYAAKGHRASTRNSKHWSTLDVALAACVRGGFAGPGFVFTDADEYFGVDLDDCLDDAGNLKPWAREILDAFAGCYHEVSPSGRGIKIFCKGQVSLPGTGKKWQVADGAVELYTTGRYFAVTGEGEGELLDAGAAGNALIARLGPGAAASEAAAVVDASLVEKCRNALNALPDAVEKQDGSGKTYLAACEILRHGIDGLVGLGLLQEFNEAKCKPPWSQKELRHKWEDAQRSVMKKREFGVALDLGFTSSGLPFSLGLVDCHDFLRETHEQLYLIPGILAERQPLIIGGPQKSLKTTIALDLALSIATGKPFLGVPEYTPTRRPPVIMLTGESGEAATQANVWRILRAKGLNDIPRGYFHLGFSLPHLSKEEQLAELARDIERTRSEVAIIDPAYLCALGVGNSDSASNVFAMGALLTRVTELSRETGCLIAFCHHSKRSPKNDWPRLDDLAFAGWPEWARQWIMLRQLAYENCVSTLACSIGGSAGHSTDLRIVIDEGKLPFVDDRREKALPRQYVVRVAARGEDEKLETLERTALGLIAAGLNTRNKLKGKNGLDTNGTQVAVIVQSLLDKNLVYVAGKSHGGQVLAVANPEKPVSGLLDENPETNPENPEND